MRVLRLCLGSLSLNVGGRAGTVDATLRVEVQCPLHAEAWRAKARVKAIGEVLAPGAERAYKSHSW